MTPTFFGRVQTRLFAVAVAGIAWTLIFTPVLSALAGPRHGDLARLYHLTFVALGLVALLGVLVFEPVYHGLQQFRWEKDWPAIFVLLQALPEGLVVHWVLGQVLAGPALSGPGFALDFGTTWLVIFACIHGPMRVPFLRWRFRGGRLL